MVTVEVLVRANFEVAVGLLALGVASDGQTLVDVDGHAAKGVNELLKAVDVEHDEVVDLEAESLAGGQLEGVSSGVVGLAHAIDVVGRHRRPNLVGHVVGVAAVAVLPDEAIGEVLVEWRISREGHLRGVAGDLEDGGVTVGGIDRRHHDRVGVHGIIGAVVARLGVVSSDEQDVDPWFGGPNGLDVLVVVDGGTSAGALVGEDPTEHVCPVVGIAPGDGQGGRDGGTQRGDEDGREPSLALGDTAGAEVQVGEGEQSDQDDGQDRQAPGQRGQQLRTYDDGCCDRRVGQDEEDGDG